MQGTAAASYPKAFVIVAPGMRSRSRIDVMKTGPGSLSQGETFDHFDGQTGRQLFTDPVGATSWMVQRSAVAGPEEAFGMPSSSISDPLDSQGCLTIAFTRRRGDGRVVASHAERLTFGQPGDTRFNLVSVRQVDVTGDGWVDYLVEARASTAQPIGTTYSPNGYRDATPGVAKRGLALLVDGRTGKQTTFVSQALSFGPGPLAVGYGAAHNRSAVLTNSPQATPNQRLFDAVVTGFTATKKTWTTSVPVFQGGWDAFATTSGPAFVTLEELPDPGTGIASLTPTYRITALDGVSGRLRWQRDFLNPVGGLEAYPFGDDIFTAAETGSGRPFPGFVARTEKSCGPRRSRPDSPKPPFFFRTRPEVAFPASSSLMQTSALLS